MRKNSIILILLSFAFSLSANNFDATVRQIALNNTELKALSSTTEGTISSLRTENNLSDPEVDYSHVWGSAGAKWDLSVSQSLRWPGLYGSRAKTIGAESDALRQANESRRLEILLEIKLTLIKIVHVKKQMALLTRQLTSIEELNQKYQKSYSAGESTLLDINKLKIERIGYEHKYDDCRVALDNLESELKNLNGGNDVKGIIAEINNYPPDVILSEDAYKSAINENDPEAKYNSMMANVESLRLRQVAKESLPDLKIGYKHVYELCDHFNGLSVGITLPFFSARNKKIAATTRQNAYNITHDYIVDSRSVEILAERKEAISLKQQLDKYSPVINDGSNIATLRKALDGGQISLLTYIQEVNYFVEAENECIEIEYEYASALARLNRYSLLQ